jgi:hypothetical protein
VFLKDVRGMWDLMTIFDLIVSPYSTGIVCLYNISHKQASVAGPSREKPEWLYKIYIPSIVLVSKLWFWIAHPLSTFFSHGL